MFCFSCELLESYLESPHPCLHLWFLSCQLHGFRFASKVFNLLESIFIQREIQIWFNSYSGEYPVPKTIWRAHLLSNVSLWHFCHQSSGFSYSLLYQWSTFLFIVNTMLFEVVLAIKYMFKSGTVIYTSTSVFCSGLLQLFWDFMLPCEFYNFSSISV